MQIQNSNKPLYQMGGAVVVHKKLVDYGIPQLVKDCLGERVPQAQYGFDDMVMSWILTVFCYGFRMVKIQNAKDDLIEVPGLNFCSHDTLGRMLKSLATKTKHDNSINPQNPFRDVKTRDVVENELLNDLLIQISIRMGVLKRNVEYTLDMDATAVETGVRDAKRTYKGFKGYMPMVCTIGQAVVYVSQRSGNANPHYGQLDCLKRTIELLKKHGIKVGTIRIDGAGYQHNIMKYLKSEGIGFVVGAKWAERTYDLMMENCDWKKRKFVTSEHSWDAEFASTPFKLAHYGDEFRMVAIRVKEEKRKSRKKNNPTKWKLKDGYYYKFIITSDKRTAPYDLFHFYHQRGTSEQNFSVLKKDFGWRILPFSNMNENLVYMLMGSIANNMYLAMLRILKKKVKTLKETMRLDTFKQLFLIAGFTVINGIIRIDPRKLDYEKIA